jgi:hypothetical protein
MIGGISAAYGVSLAAARFDRAVSQVSAAAAAEGDPGAVTDGGGLTDAMVGMAAAKYAFLASLQVARVSNEMIGEMLGTYGVGQATGGT